MAKTQPDRIAIKRQLSFLGSVDWWLTNFMTNIIFQVHLIFILVMLERTEAYQDPKYDVAYADKGAWISDASSSAQVLVRTRALICPRNRIGAQR